MESSADLVDYLTRTAEIGGSDLHLAVGAPPVARVHGSLVALSEQPLDGNDTRDLILGVLTSAQRARLEKDWHLDLGLEIENLGRFRGNVHFVRGQWEAAFRVIAGEIPELDNLGHSIAVADFCRAQQGLLLVTGITGSGKTTTLAAMTKKISDQRSGVIVTLEDPIEFRFNHGSALVKQRELGTDFHSFAEGLRSAMRQDPDVILVAEMRDLETVSTAITAAETGHLVISTLHTIDAPKSIDRIVDVFPPEQKHFIMAQLANCLVGVISQRLLPRADGQGRVMASEVMVVNSGIRTAIREGKTQLLPGMIEIGGNHNMHTIDDSLQHLLTEGYISEDEAATHARNPVAIHELARALEQQQQQEENKQQRRGFLRR